MNVETQSIFDLAPKRLQWLSTRQKVVAENIAKADVKGYRGSDTESFESYLGRTHTQGGLLQPDVIEAKVGWAEDLSGNNVVLEEQIIEANANASQFRIAADLYRKAHQMLHTVAGRR